MFKRAITILLGLCLVLVPTSLHSAPVQGTLGSTSTGSVDISMSVPNLVKVSSLLDIDMGTYVPGFDLSGFTDACVYRNGTGAYKVKLTSANPSGTNDFRLKLGGTYIIYDVTWTDATPVTTAMVSGVTIAANQLGSSTSVNCSGGTNATLSTSTTDTRLQNGPPGSYGDTITILVTAV